MDHSRFSLSIVENTFIFMLRFTCLHGSYKESHVKSQSQIALVFTQGVNTQNNHSDKYDARLVSFVPKSFNIFIVTLSRCCLLPQEDKSRSLASLILKFGGYETFFKHSCTKVIYETRQNRGRRIQMDYIQQCRAYLYHTRGALHFKHSKQVPSVVAVSVLHLKSALHRFCTVLL